MSRSKPKHLVIDTSVYINYTRHQKLYRLINAIVTYDLIVYLSPELIAELEKNIALTSAVTLPKRVFDNYLLIIKNACHIIEPIPQYNQSPDPKDNFLFDLAVQTNSQIIITKEKALLNFSNTPIPVHDIKWFKETYPVDL